MIDWTEEIEKMTGAKRLVASNDREGFAPFVPPRPPAEADHLGTVTEWAGDALGRQYVEFLRHANGWPELLHDLDLFGTSELLGAELNEALELLDMLGPGILEEAGLQQEQLFPIGMGSASIDVFVISGMAPDARPVIWLAGLVVERFEDFGAFFQYMTASNEELAGKLALE